MTISVLDTVVLTVDIQERGLRVGDIGAVVELYGSEGAEVEFITGSGKTQAVLTLKQSQIRRIGDDEILAVRSVDAA